MTKDVETLTELVAARVGPGRAMTYSKFQERAIDKESGHRPSRGVLWKIANGERVIIDKELVGAIAAGLNLPLERVQAAAAYQYTGLVATPVNGGLVVHEPGVDADTPRSRDEVRRQRGREPESGG